jgi:hypothetical protein
LKAPGDIPSFFLRACMSALVNLKEEETMASVEMEKKL